MLEPKLRRCVSHACEAQGVRYRLWGVGVGECHEKSKNLTLSAAQKSGIFNKESTSLGL